jgi:lipopolysaccharide transport system permease protein
MTSRVTSATMIRRGGAPRERGLGVLRLIRSIARQRALVLEMARRELTDMHAGQAAGIVWVAVHPLLLFAVYAFLFTAVFRVRIADRGPSDYLIYLFAGLTPWLLTQDVMTRATHVMTSNISIVKKVMFPVEVLVAKTLTASLAVQLVLLCSVLLYIVGARVALPLTFLLLPVLFLIHLTFLWGLSLLLASMTPYFRDVHELVRVFVTVNIYLMPVMYLPDMVPEALRFTLGMNPFSSLIWCYQDVLYFGTIAHPGAWLMLTFLAMATLAAGSYIFVRLRHHFASVL